MKNKISYYILALVLALFISEPVYAASGEHGAQFSAVLFSLAIILVVAKIGGHIAVKFRQPEVLGELLGGVLIGNLALFGYSGFEFFKTDFTLTMLSELGVVLLLFMVGLESSVKEMMQVGSSSFLAAIFGVVVPIFLGFGASYYFFPQADMIEHFFVGTVLCATSVGITARVLKDLGHLDTKEARIILGAAVIDDVLGLVILSVMVGLVTAAEAGTTLSALPIIKIVVGSFGFIVGALFFGRWVSPFLFKIATRLHSEGLLLAFALAVCFALSYAASLIGLAPIVGAFTAGLLLEPVHYADLRLKTGEDEIDHLIHPIVAFLVPVFFVTMGAKVDISIFADTSILMFALVLSIVAVLGKQVCSLGVIEKGVDKLTVGFGMIPRGEVGLIFASVGAGLVYHGHPVISHSTNSAIIVMVMLTTIIAPILLKMRISKKIS